MKNKRKLYRLKKGIENKINKLKMYPADSEFFERLDSSINDDIFSLDSEDNSLLSEREIQNYLDQCNKIYESKPFEYFNNPKEDLLKKYCEEY